MSLGNCIPDMIERGEIDRARGKRMLELFQKLERHYARDRSPAAAAADASEATLKQLAFEAQQAKRQRLLQIDAQQRAGGDVDRYKGESRYAAIGGLLAGDQLAHYGNIETAAQRLDFQMQGELYDFVQHHRRNLLGRPMNAAELDAVALELHGQASGNDRAKLFADAIGDTFEYLRKRFNRAGGAIGKLEGFGLPHRHDWARVRAAGYEAWAEFVRPLLDTAKMRDRNGGEFTAETLDEALKDTFENIRTNGMRGEASSNATGGGKLANRRAEHRFLHFRDGEAWLAYHEAYGSGNIFELVTGHIRSMSYDIAAMERLGPNTEATMRWLLDRADIAEAASARSAPAALSGASASRAGVEHLWNFMSGEYSRPVVYEGFAAPVLNVAVSSIQGARNLVTAAYLGSATISSATDFHTRAMAQKMAGLPEVTVLSGFLKQMNPANDAHRRAAVRLGLGMRDAAHSLGSAHRMVMQMNGPGWTKVLADDVLRLSLLNKVTEAQQRDFGMTFLGTLADARAQPFDAINPDLRRTMERHGVDATTWDTVRSGPVESHEGVDYLSLRAIEDDRAADRIMDMVLGETSIAVQESGARDRALLTYARPGTFIGELSATATQFKSFTFGLMRNQMNRIAAIADEQGAVPSSKYTAQLAIGLWLLGAGILQTRELIKGRDLRPMDNWEFWGDAMVAGGGLLVVGDLMGVVTSGRVGSWAEWAAGPVAGFAGDITKIAKAKNKGGATAKMIRRNTPGANIFWARLAVERLVMDRIQENIDPNYRQSWGMMQRRARKDGQGIWWAPGTDAPQRAPNLATAGSEAGP